jgi:hypothetical protein
MEPAILFHPEKRLVKESELAKLLRFNYLSQLSFESAGSRQEIKARGMQKWKEGRVAAEAVEMGARFSAQIAAARLPVSALHWISEEVGFGLIAQEKIEAGAFVGEYTGIVRKNDRRYLEPLNNYCYEYPVEDEMGRSYVIDATSGNLTRFINHSFCPNLRPVHIFFEGFYHLIFLALCDIAPGSQLTYNYGPTYWYVRSPPAPL